MRSRISVDPFYWIIIIDVIIDIAVALETVLETEDVKSRDTSFYCPYDFLYQKCGHEYDQKAQSYDELNHT